MTSPLELLSLIRMRNVQADTHAVIMEQIWKDFGRSVRQTRKNKKIALAVFAKRLGFTSTYVSFLESGKRRWSMTVAEKAVRMLARAEQWPDCPVSAPTCRKKR